MLAVMSGAADDLALGIPGLHHWGEHVPFRGTRKFPQGSRQIMGRIAELGGRISAFTNHLQTVYYASAPRSHWKEAAEIVVDLAAQPIGSEADIEAERRIILQEMTQGDADIDRRAAYHTRESLWSPHAMSQRVIGTRESLLTTGAESFAMMREQSYARSRCVVFVAGHMPVDHVVSDVSELLEVIPSGGLRVSERRMPASYGALPPWNDGYEYIADSEFDATSVSLLFPVSAQHSERERDSLSLISCLLATGSLASPLLRIVREERQLVYNANVSMLMVPDGGVFGLSAKTSRAREHAVVHAFRAVLALPEVRSEERWEYVRNVLTAQNDMHLPDPAAGTRRMLDGLTRNGSVSTRAEAFDRFLSVPHEQVLSTLDDLSQLDGCVVSLRGTK